ncbi:hypothetical protein M1446_05705 [Candidatus Dependentiae bacterium]|nr:hypothetical protein [Candidatus Dependentiae bacterium]
MKVKYIYLMSLIFYSTNLLSLSWERVNPLKAKYLKNLRALTEMESTIKEIEATRKQIIEAEKNIAKQMAPQKEKFEAAVNKAKKSLNELSKEIIDNVERKIEDLKGRSANSQAEISKLQDALKQENQILNTAKTINQYALGWVSYAVQYLQSSEDVRKKDLENSIDQLRKKIENYQKQIADEKKSLTAIFSSPDYQRRASDINKDLQTAQKDLSQVVIEANKLRKEQIFNPYNEKAETLIKKLNQLIKDADCSTIKNIGDAKDATITACKQRRIESIKKAFPKSKKCGTLTVKSSLQEIDACMQDVQ